MRPIFWNNARINEMRTLADEGKNAMDIAQKFGVGVDALRCQARFYGVKIGGKNSYFTPREDRIIRDMAHLGWAVVADDLDRTRETVTRRAMKLGVKSGLTRNWSEHEDAILKRMAATGASWGEISGEIERSIDAISNRAKRLGIGRVHVKEKMSPVVKARPAKRVKRKCLGPCGQYFESAWIGNRHCKSCASWAARQSGAMA